MKINYLSITFWFDIFTKHEEIIPILNQYLKKEFPNFNIISEPIDDLTNPIIIGFNKEEHSRLTISKINLQYTMETDDFAKIPLFKENALNLMDFLIEADFHVFHTAIFLNGEMANKKALEEITKNTLNKKLIDDDLIDVSLKLGKKTEDLFYKIISILNKKQVKIPKKVNEDGFNLPIPLISWREVIMEQELIDVCYEINDKYSFDFTKNYHTTPFYLNKMLYLLEHDFLDDVDNLIKKGKF